MRLRKDEQVATLAPVIGSDDEVDVVPADETVPTGEPVSSGDESVDPADTPD
jgi:hypothetical protein